MFSPFDRRAKTASSEYPYPRPLFHSIRSFQLIASLVVGATMLYFIHHLVADHWKTPWTFIWLTSASLFSIAALAFTIILHCCIGLNPRLNIALNSFLAILWCLSWSLLTWYMSGTLSNFCDIEHWNEDVGIMVCRIYKALFTFTLLGMLSTLAALTLDIYVYRQRTRLGIYKLHDHDAKRPAATHGPFTDDAPTYGDRGMDEPKESDAWEAPGRPSMGPYMESADTKPQQNGYAVLDEQFGYDTGYHGAHPAPHEEGRLYGQ